jgi:large conductance mechanosensitive channel
MLRAHRFYIGQRRTSPATAVARCCTGDRGKYDPDVLGKPMGRRNGRSRTVRRLIARRVRKLQERHMQPIKTVGSVWQEFKSFAFKGNIIDLAVAVVIGAAFGAVIKSIVDNIIMPLVGYVTPKMTYTEWHLGKVMIGKFLGDLLNFLIVAFAVFITIVKLLGAVMKRVAAEPPPGAPVTRECPFCLSIIPIKATKCAHCTADLPNIAAVPQV